MPKRHSDANAVMRADFGFTGISFSREVPQREERRLEARHLAVLQVAKLVSMKRQMLCLVRNISSGGAKVFAFTSLPVAERIGIEFRSGVRADGRVIWSEDKTAGIRFDTPVDILKLLVSDAEGAEGPLPRHPRLRVEAFGHLGQGMANFPVEVIDISQTGVCVEFDEALRPDRPVTLAIEGLPPVSSRPVWVKGNRAGLAFDQAMPFDVLGYWALSQGARIVLV